MSLTSVANPLNRSNSMLLYQQLRPLRAAIKHAIVPASCLPSIDAVATSLYVALEKTNHRPTKALQRMRAIALDEEQARLLDVNEGDPSLFAERYGFLGDGRVIEITRMYYRGDAYDFVPELAV